MGHRQQGGARCRAAGRSAGAGEAARRRRDRRARRGEAAAASQLERIARDADGARGAGDRRARAHDRCARRHRGVHRQAPGELQGLMMRCLLLALMALPLLAAAADDDYTLLGAGIRTRPKFDGSREQVTDLIPVIRYYGQPWFARTTQGILEGGARVNVARDFDVGVQLAYEQGPLDRDWGTSIGAHAEWDPTVGQMPLYLVARLRQHLDT